MSNVLIQCVVVLYKCTLDNSGTMQSLAELCRQQSDLAQQIALLIYDNSPSSQLGSLDRWSFGSVEYLHDPANSGLATAYNEALQRAQQHSIEWLLLLDQDTVLNFALFRALFTAIGLPVPDNICAIVPKLMQDGKIFSPQIVGRFHNIDCPSIFSGIYKQRVTALNSAACLRVRTVLSVGGFSREYWLEYLDHITFHRLQAAGGRVLILDIAIEHRLSLHNLESEMSLDRYTNVLGAEWQFIRETGFGGGRVVHRLRLLRRALTQTIRLRNKAYALKTLRAAVE